MAVFRFLEDYELLNSSETYKPIDLTPRQCIFCKRNETQGATFNTKAHLIPEFLGKHSLINPNECDDCNQKFARFETDLAAFVSPYLTFSKIKNKKGKVPASHSRRTEKGEKTKILPGDGKNLVHINFGKNVQDYIVDEDAKTATIVFRQQPYVPLNVYKSFVKIGISVLPENYLRHYDETCEWLLSDEYFSFPFFRVFQTFLLTNYVARPTASVFVAKQIAEGESEYPEMTLLLRAANLVFQIFLPFSSVNAEHHKHGRNLEFTVYPSPILDRLPVRSQIDNVDLSSPEKSKQEVQLTLSYGAIERGLQG